MFPPTHEKAILVFLNFNSLRFQDDLTEFKELVVSAGADVVHVVTGIRKEPDPKYYVGSGKAQEIKEIITVTQADLVIVNHPLSPAQERNLERLIQCRVLDRYGLILDIFAKRARTFEGKLQVELALLQHLSTRLVRGWTHLERQKGGIGLRGPGETQLEVDRRLIRDRIKTITKKLEKVRQQRQQSRRMRQRALIPTVALVGYTNAGKSTLFNQLTQADVYVAHQLFATLDPTLRRIPLPHAGDVVVADTVGFISDLPHELIEAFSATLEETRDADLMLHVIDAHHHDVKAQIAQVEHVLAEIGAVEVPMLYVFNKIDLLPDRQATIEHDGHNKPKQVWISAACEIGLDLLKQAMAELLYGEPIRRQIILTPQEGQLRAQLYKLKAVVLETVDEEGNWLMTISLSKRDFERLFSK